MKFWLQRFRVDRDGCDHSGVYWGVGSQLYQAVSAVIGVNVSRVVRAADREAAKAEIQREFPGARFFR